MNRFTQVAVDMIIAAMMCGVALAFLSANGFEFFHWLIGLAGTACLCTAYVARALWKRSRDAGSDLPTTCARCGYDVRMQKHARINHCPECGESLGLPPHDRLRVSDECPADGF